MRRARRLRKCARRLVREDRLHDALAALNQAIQLTPQEATLYDDRGLVQALLFRTREALQSYEQALALTAEPNVQASIYFHRALLYRRQGDHDQALLDVKRACRLDPQHATYREALAVLQSMERS